MRPIRNSLERKLAQPTSLVTGAAGFIGSHIAEGLLARGHRVLALDNLSGGVRGNVPAGAEFIQGDLGDFDFVRRLFAEQRPRFVFHLAAYAAEGLSPFIRSFNYANNVVASAGLISCAIEFDVERFVFTSSIAVYGDQTPPFSESRPKAPIDPYGLAKAVVEDDLELARRQFGLSYTIFRPHNVYGERQNINDPYRNVIGIFMWQCLMGEPLTIFGDGEQSRAVSYVGDVVPALLDCITIPKAETPSRWSRRFDRPRASPLPISPTVQSWVVAPFCLFIMARWRSVMARLRPRLALWSILAAVVAGIALRITLPVWFRAVAIKEVEAAGGSVAFGELRPAFLRRAFGADPTNGLTPVLEVHLTGTAAGRSGAAHLGWLPEAEVLALADTPIGDLDIAGIRGFRELRELSLDSTNITDAGLLHVGTCTALTKLSVSEAAITDAGVQHLSRLSRLVVLNVSATAVTNAGVRHLRSLPKLGSVNLDDTLVSDQALEDLKAIRSLIELRLSGTRVTDSGVRQLADFPSLRDLSLSRTRLTDDGFAEIARLSRLEDVAHTKITDGGLAQIGSMAALETLNLGGCKVSGEGLAFLRHVPNLRWLILRDTSVTDDDITKLRGCKVLERLDLAGTKVTPKGAARLKGAMPHLWAIHKHGEF